MRLMLRFYNSLDCQESKLFQFNSLTIGTSVKGLEPSSSTPWLLELLSRVWNLPVQLLPNLVHPGEVLHHLVLSLHLEKLLVQPETVYIWSHVLFYEKSTNSRGPGNPANFLYTKLPILGGISVDLWRKLGGK